MKVYNICKVFCNKSQEIVNLVCYDIEHNQSPAASNGVSNLQRCRVAGDLGFVRGTKAGYAAAPRVKASAAGQPGNQG